MVLDFHNLPHHLQIQVCNKTDFKEHVQLQMSSRSIHETLKYVKTLPHKMHRWTVKRDCTFRMGRQDGTRPIQQLQSQRFAEECVIEPVRMNFYLLWIEGELTDDVIYRLEPLLAKQWRFQKIMLCDHVTCAPEAFNRLIELSRGQSLVAFFAPPHVQLASIYLQQPAARKMTGYLHLRSTVEDTEFAALSFTSFRLTANFVTSVGLNMFLKQWVAGEREVLSESCVDDGNFPLEEYGLVLEGIPHQVLWNEGIWAASDLSGIPKDRIDGCFEKSVFGIEAGNRKLVFQQRNDTLVWFKPVVCFEEFMRKCRQYALGVAH